MHQNSPTAIADLKNFPGRNPRTPVSEGAAMRREREGKGQDGRWVGNEGGEEGGMEVGDRGRGGLEPPL